MTGIKLAVDRCREQQAAAFLQPDKTIAPSRIVGTKTSASNGNQAAAVRKTRQRGRNMPERGIGDAPVHMSCHRERRVHQHDGRTDVGIEMIVDVSSVIPGDANAAEQSIEQTRACIREFVEMQLCTSELGMDRKEPSAG